MRQNTVKKKTKHTHTHKTKTAKRREKEILLLMLYEKTPSPDCSAVRTWLAACIGASPVPSNLPLPAGENFQMLIFFLFENINNYYFVLCGISGLLFHSPVLSFGSEFLRDFEGLVWSLIWQRLCSKCLGSRDLLHLPNLEFPLWATSDRQSLVLLEALTAHILMRGQAPDANTGNGSGLCCTLRVLRPNSWSPFSLAKYKNIKGTWMWRFNKGKLFSLTGSITDWMCF